MGSAWISTCSHSQCQIRLKLFEMHLSPHHLLPPSPPDSIFLHWLSFLHGVLVYTGVRFQTPLKYWPEWAPASPGNSAGTSTLNAKSLGPHNPGHLLHPEVTASNVKGPCEQNRRAHSGGSGLGWQEPEEAAGAGS